jgi:hypothetical protein
MERTPQEESDQRPEEGAPEYTPDDTPGGAREEARENPGGRDDEDSDAGDATGNPANAG